MCEYCYDDRVRGVVTGELFVRSDPYLEDERTHKMALEKSTQ